MVNPDFVLIKPGADGQVSVCDAVFVLISFDLSFDSAIGNAEVRNSTDY